MSKGKIIKTVLISASLCAALYQAAQFMDVLSSAKGQNPAAALIPGGVLPGQAGAQLDSLNAAMQAGQADFAKRFGATTGATPPAPKELVVFSPDGRKLTPEQAEALRKQAERNRPKPPAQAPKDGGNRR